ncbi:MAG: 30S ribosomal protein S8 [Candidatus Niyogibacteria bacterium CG10_big_fil_rev_8_21_14_0_10_42_19]|uniref:Small ribosomal subunit protein uS8 n=1 Tax=Candidatus Niyogibacteria bacterium CG10_big_fil_rev_8_21_14_0_10_42_19 TaxID=1974725 RepID=A0A2H0TFC9_9BACT|nr:MAG: 30S ribosomal protein S8 [Candidatus Niyogibacteria bacterium CG10_big_fil_rev_8_21_14_0_10_42_19]
MDPIADMFVIIVNAQRVQKQNVSVSYSKLKMEIAKLFESKGYIKEAVRHGRKTRRTIDIVLNYTGDKPAIENIRRISKPSRRIYSGWRQLKTYRKGRGFVIISTPKGIMGSGEAEKSKLGGEVLGRIL